MKTLNTVVKAPCLFNVTTGIDAAEVRHWDGREDYQTPTDEAMELFGFNLIMGTVMDEYQVFEDEWGNTIHRYVADESVWYTFRDTTGNLIHCMETAGTFKMYMYYGLACSGHEDNFLWEAREIYPVQQEERLHQLLWDTFYAPLGQLRPVIVMEQLDDDLPF